MTNDIENDHIAIFEQWSFKKLAKVQYETFERKGVNKEDVLLFNRMFTILINKVYDREEFTWEDLLFVSTRMIDLGII